MTNQINDWDVMQSGYSDEQLYPQQLEVLDMHDVPCTTKVLDLPIQPNFPQAILDAERKCGANHG